MRLHLLPSVLLASMAALFGTSSARAIESEFFATETDDGSLTFTITQLSGPPSEIGVFIPEEDRLVAYPELLALDMPVGFATNVPFVLQLVSSQDPATQIFTPETGIWDTGDGREFFISAELAGFSAFAEQ